MLPLRVEDVRKRAEFGARFRVVFSSLRFLMNRLLYTKSLNRGVATTSQLKRRVWEHLEAI